MNKHIILLTVLLACSAIVSFAGPGADTAGHSGYKPGILYAVQFQFTENGLGLGMGYERRLGDKGMFAVCIPAVVTFDVANSNRIYDYNTGMYRTGKADAMWYAMPGIKFYPAGSYGRVKYATGAAVEIGAGQKSSNLTDLWGLNETEQVQRHFLCGLLWQNSLTMNLTNKVCIGAELGVGGTLTNRVGGVQAGNETLVEGCFKLGFRI